MRLQQHAWPGNVRDAVLLQVVALDLPPVWQFEDIRTLPFHEERALVGGGPMMHEL
jgi:hypothetical protein